MLYQLCCYKDRDAASSGFSNYFCNILEIALFKKALPMRIMIQAPLSVPGFAYSMKHLPRQSRICLQEPSRAAPAAHGSGVLCLHPKPCFCTGGTGKAPVMLLVPPPAAAGSPCASSPAAARLWVAAAVKQ